ncbi:GntR family transcriptional regulator [Arthrobacter alpinus]|uniref:GntR family transcriptional regulator n=1 Tax=Arthrobacter alpinus TaxID=656366 RepID=UPI0005C82AEA|nr:GntR family transcriptional regulator [Arthrobacter alpinus]ALV46377.1 GntR family transcriptional regulator [Arthrobacter alpinus]
MEPRIVIDLETATPPYEQVQAQIRSLIAVGELPSGTRLPTVRSLAGDLGIAAGTVARAYKELEAAGFVTTNRRQGTTVTRPHLSGELAPASGQARPPLTDEVMAAVERLVEEGARAGLDGKTLLTLLQGRLNRQGK